MADYALVVCGLWPRHWGDGLIWNRTVKNSKKIWMGESPGTVEVSGDEYDMDQTNKIIELIYMDCLKYTANRGNPCF